MQDCCSSGFAVILVPVCVGLAGQQLPLTGGLQGRICMVCAADEGNLQSVCGNSRGGRGAGCAAPVGAQETGTTPQHMLAFAVSIDTVPVLTLGLCEPQTLCRAEW